MDYELISTNLCTFGFHIIENFLEPEHYHSLQFIAQDRYQKGLFKSAKIGLNLQAQQNTTIRTDEICWVDDTREDPAIQAYLQTTNHLASILNQSLFLGLAEFETHFALYQPGTFYKKHIDQFATTKTRKISCVFYLNQKWQQEFGGELKLYNQENELIQTIIPQGNRFICFNSELPHEVCITHQPRYSITGWMKTRSTSLYSGR